MLSHVISIPFIALHSTHAALQLKPPQSPLLPCRTNILFLANLYCIYIHTCASNLFIINDDIVFFSINLYVSCLPHFTSLFLWESVSLLARFDCLPSNLLKGTAQFFHFAFVPVVPVYQSRSPATRHDQLLLFLSDCALFFSQLFPFNVFTLFVSRAR